MYLDEGAHLDHVDTVINIGKQNIIHQSQGEDLKPTTPWNLPNSVDSFTGREEELKDLKSALTKDGKSFISQNIVGLSGIGKTSLAVEYAWRNKEDYDFIAFIKASSQDSLTNDFKELGIMFRFQEQQPIRNIIQFVYRKLSEYRSVLLIFDDAESLSIIRGQGLETGSNCNFEVPQIYNNKIHWLVTTKNQNFSDKSVIKLKEFSLDEARSYIKDRIPDLSKDDLLLVESLAITLGRFPLALSYATAYIKQNKDLDFSILKYLDLYKTQEEERKKLLSLKIETELHIPVYNTWQISIRALEKHQKSIEILKYCACLAPEIIPLSFIKLIINTDSEIEFNEALQELKKYSFIEIQEFQREGSIKGIIVHSLLQEVIRLDLKEQYNIKLNFIVSKIQETYPTNKKQMSDYSFAIMLIPHLNVLIKKNKENILLLQMTADAYDCLGNYNEQKELLEEALAIKVKHYQTREHIDVAGTLNNLGNAYGSLGNYNKQKELLEEVLDIKVKHYQTREHIDVAMTLDNLGNAYGRLGNYNKKKELLEEALAIKVKHYQTREHIDVAGTLNNLGNAYGSLGNYNKQKELLEEALDIKVKHYQTREHIDAAGTLNNLGNAYGSLGNYNKQKELLEEVLAIQIKHHKTREHIDVATTLDNLGNAYGNLGNYNKKKELLEEALAIKVKHYQTREHIDVAITMASLAQVYSVKNDFQQALKLIENAYQILQEYLKRGENHPFIKRVLNIKQKIEKAALSIAPDTWLRFRLEKLEKKSDDEETHLALGDYYMHIEDINNAIAHYEKIVALLPEQALADHNLACCYNVRGQEEDKALAVKHFERAIALKPTSSVFCEYGHFLYQLFNKTIPINRGLLEETTLQLIQAINLADDTIINYGNLEKPVIEEYLQRLIGEQGEIIIKPSCLAYYLLIKSYFILGHYVDAKQSLDNFEKHLVNLFNISADGSSNNLQIEHLLLDKIKGEYITKHKHKDARMQHEYDKRFGLIVWHSTTRKAQKFSEATLKAISQDKEKYSLFYKVVTEYDMEALDVLMAAGLVNLQEPFLKSTMLHMCLQKFTISIGKFISNDCKLSENPTQKVCDVIDLLFEKADANIKNGQEETPLQIIDRFCPVVVEEIHNEEFNACKQKLLGYANRYHSTEVNNHNEILVSKIKLKFSGKYAQTYFPISEKYAYLPEIANKNLEDKPINLFNKYKR